MESDPQSEGRSIPRSTISRSPHRKRFDPSLTPSPVEEGKDQAISNHPIFCWFSWRTMGVGRELAGEE